MSRYRQLKRTTLFISCLIFSPWAIAKDVVVGIILDGPSQRQVLPVSAIERESATLMGKEFSVRFPKSKIRHGDWTISGIRSAIKEQLSDPTIDVVIANGLIASHEIMQIEQLGKPVIATVIADAVLQKLPLTDGTSGKQNLVYLADDHTVGSDLDIFQSMIGFKHLAIFVDQLFIDTLPELVQTTAAARERLNIKISLVPVRNSAVSALTDLPTDTDAVYIPPLPRFTEALMQELAAGLIERRLPSFSLLGLDTLELGLLMSGAGRSVDITRAARRVALNLQSIALGTNASELKVGLSQPQKLAINMRTARAIGYAPRWREIEAAILLYEDSNEDLPSYTLVEALSRSIESNLALQIRSIDRDLASNDAAVARSALLPQLSARTATNFIDEDRASPGFAAEREADLGLEASQLIYSERTRSTYDIATLLANAQDHAFRSSALDLVQQTATAYLQLLQAQAQEAVLSSNVSLTEKNLELALSRQKIGQAGRSDVYRWESQLASDRQALYGAASTTDQAMTELQRILDLDLRQSIAVSDAGIASLIQMLDSERFQRFFDNAQKFAIFRQYQVDIALHNAPELRQLDAQIAAAERRSLAAKRAYYVPDISIVGQANTNVLRGGAGASRALTGLDDDEWSIGVQAALPLFQGGARRAEKSIANNELFQLALVRRNTENTIKARTIAAIQQAGATYPAMRLSQVAARAAQANLGLVTQSYSVGAVSVIQLIDAQDAALRAKLSTAQARYAFMIDFINVLRAAADFDLLFDSDREQAWYLELDEYFSQHGG